MGTKKKKRLVRIFV